MRGWDYSNGESGHEMVAKTLHDHQSCGCYSEGGQSNAAYFERFLG